MPFIRGRYHINPIAGGALEAARQAEEALAALQQAEQGDSDESSRDGYDSAQDSNSDNERGPIHRVEIEATELVPSQLGRAGKGFVARVHRASYAEPDDSGSSAGRSFVSPARVSLLQKPETHVFADHNALMDFLQNELAKNCEK